MSDETMVVSAEWLRKRMASHMDGLVLLDTTWLPKLPEVNQTSQEAYESLHITGAQHLDLDACVTKTQYIPRNPPEPASFEKYLRKLGICPESHVIVYDRDNGDTVLTAAAPRVCFLLKAYGLDRVSWLNGGLVNWTKTGGQTESGPPPDIKPGNFIVSIRKELLLNFEDMKSVVGSNFHQIINTRLPVHFNGEIEEPSEFTRLILTDGGFPFPDKDHMITGHMPGAVNIPFTTPYVDLISIRSKDELKKRRSLGIRGSFPFTLASMMVFLEAGITDDKPLVTTCYIGHTAATMAFLALWCGYSNVKLYYGSWTEYGQRAAKDK